MSKPTESERVKRAYPLKWESENNGIRGFIVGEEDTTLFLISLEEGGLRLSGAFSADGDPGCLVDTLHAAKRLAEVLMSNWIILHPVPEADTEEAEA